MTGKRFPAFDAMFASALRVTCGFRSSEKLLGTYGETENCLMLNPEHCLDYAAIFGLDLGSAVWFFRPEERGVVLLEAWRLPSDSHVLQLMLVSFLCLVPFTGAHAHR